MLTHRIAFAAMVFVLSACASADLSGDKPEKVALTDDPRKGEEVRKICFTSSIDGFGETDRNAVVVSEGMDRYLVETFAGCFDLDSAQSIAFDRNSGCLTRGDKVIAFDSAFGHDNFGSRSVPCRINKIYEWDREAEEMAKKEES